jgi:hypothetical protein
MRPTGWTGPTARTIGVGDEPADREFADRDQAWDRVGAWVLFIVLVIGNQLMSNSAVRERQAGAQLFSEPAAKL